MQWSTAMGLEQMVYLNGQLKGRTLYDIAKGLPKTKFVPEKVYLYNLPLLSMRIFASLTGLHSFFSALDGSTTNLGVMGSHVAVVHSLKNNSI